MRKKAPRAATACPAAVPCWVLRVVRLDLADTLRLSHYIAILFETRRTRCLLRLAAGRLLEALVTHLPARAAGGFTRVPSRSGRPRRPVQSSRAPVLYGCSVPCPCRA